MEDCTYLIQQDNFLKIGYTLNLKKRLKQYNTHNVNYKVLKVIKGDYEKELHSMFKNLQYRDEWFYYSDDIIKQFDLYKNKYLTDKTIPRKSPSKPIFYKTSKLLKICNKYIYNVCNKKYILSNDPRLEKELQIKNINKNKFFKTLIDRNVITKERNCWYILNE